jgi:hypothetical protein
MRGHAGRQDATLYVRQGCLTLPRTVAEATLDIRHASVCRVRPTFLIRPEGTTESHPMNLLRLEQAYGSHGECGLRNAE